MNLYVKLLLLLIFFFISSVFISCNLGSISDPPHSNNNGSAELIVEMLYFDTDSINCYYWDNNAWRPHKMEKLSPRQFKFLFPSQSGEYRFGLVYYMHNEPSSSLGYFKSTNSINSITGIKYSKLKVNGFELDKKFLTTNFLNNWADLAFNISTSGEPTLAASSYSISNDISPEVNHPLGMTNPEFQSLFQTSTHLQGWLVALHNNHDDRRYQSSSVEVEFIKLYQKIGGQYYQMGNTYFYVPNSQFNDGGLYVRYPYFPNDPSGYDYHEPMPGIINSQGILTFNPSNTIDRVWHWWPEPRQQFDLSATDFKIEAKIKINGPVSVQAGMDFKTINTHRGEVASGDWSFGPKDWHIIVCESNSGN